MIEKMYLNNHDSLAISSKIFTNNKRFLHVRKYFFIINVVSNYVFFQMKILT